MKRLFKNPTLILNTLGNPLQDGTFRFDKGAVKNFRHKYIRLKPCYGCFNISF